MDEKKVQNNNRKANLIANLAEIVIVILYLILNYAGIGGGMLPANKEASSGMLPANSQLAIPCFHT